MNSIFNKQISVYKNITDNKGVGATLLSFLTCQEYINDVQKIRAIQDKKIRNELKKKLPCATISGLFDPTRKRDNLKQHSGFICIDIDKQDNEHIKNFNDLKNQLCKLNEIAYIALSVSGQGYFCIVPLKNPNKHAAHFRALQEDFKRYNINIDVACKDVTRLRVYSYDAEPYINEKASPYEPMIDIHHKPTIHYPTLNTEDNVSVVVNEITRQCVNIVDTYNDWLTVGCALASELGESGRSYFHVISSISSKYNVTECDKKYNECLKTNRITIGSFFQIAKNHGITYYNKQH